MAMATNFNASRTSLNSLEAECNKCNICLSAQKPMVITNCCNQNVHEECIITWLKTKKSSECSLCRQDPLPLEKEDGNYNHKDKNNRYFESALMKAIRKGNIDFIKDMIEKDSAIIDQKHHSFYTGLRRTLLGMAASFDQTEIMKLLLDKGAKINKQDSIGETPLMCAIIKEQDEAIDLLLQHDAKVNKQDHEGKTVVHKAASVGRVDILKLLCEKTADVKINTFNGCTPLITACMSNKLEAAKFLLEKGVKVNAATIDRKITALFMASQNGNTELVKSLLDAKAKPNKATANNRTPLSVACENGFIEVAQLLLDAGADVNHCNNHGVSPLYWAARKGHAELVKLLLTKGADKALKYKYAFWDRGETPREAAIRARHMEIACLLESA